MLLLSPKGRIRRRDYWLGILALVILGALSAFMELLVGLPFLSYISGLFFLYVFVVLMIKRLHDLDRTGWFSLLAFIPVLGALVWFVWLGFFRGVTGPNQYGKDPILQ